MIAQTASPVGSVIFFVIALLVTSIAVLLILRYYLPLRTTPAYLLVPVFFGLWLPASVVLLVPIDLASSARTDDVATRGIWLPDRVLLVSWRITYWLTFALTWFILPILGEYSDAGYREPKDKLKYSLRSNAQYQAAVFGSGILGLIYVFIFHGVSVPSLKGTVMALAYCWGLALAIYLMGHGLVAIPRRLFRNASISGRLRRIQAQAPRVYEKMEESEMKLEDLEIQVSELSRRKVGSARDFSDWIEELVDMTSLPESHPRSGALLGSGEETHLPTVITEKYMADLTRHLVRARHARERYAGEWNRLLQEAVKTQAILDSGASKKLDFGRPTPGASALERLTLLTPYTRYLFHYRFMPYARIFLGGFLSLASVCIVWSEIIKVALPNLSVIRLTVVHHWTGNTGQVGFAGQVIAALWILYMCAAALTSITEVKVWRGRALVRRNTAHESAFWYSSQVARLSVPLSYNFLTFLSRKVYKQTVFYSFLGELIELTTAGAWFDTLFPMLILIPVSATLFGLYGKIKRLIGLGDIIDDDDEGEDGTGYGTGSWREGRDLIEREIHGTSIRSRREAAAGRLAAGGDGPSGRAAPVLSIPGARRSGAAPTTPFGTSPTPGIAPATTAAASGARRIGQASGGGAGLAEAEDDNFFAALGHRIKNTVDTIDTPRWFQDIKKPKWMGNGDGEGSGSGSRPGHPARGNSDVRRWFGGGEGRIRL
ncbi:LMBR1 domain-containing protein [Pleurostoma richardsiae]|uniref:LMBR1 domain-containing protein n=1 Tax=Pleurostoma richardsiae TaxID=41990 RepID=A0AA38R396_9PEZI|nr:LMBR1 domain-containing protein [Pleurostoma richardsiae]